MTQEEISNALYRRSLGKSTGGFFHSSKLNDKDADRLIAAYRRVQTASRGGVSDWSGGGNPHRMMEESERNYAEDDFRELCKDLHLDSGYVWRAFSDAESRLRKEGHSISWSTD